MAELASAEKWNHEQVAYEARAEGEDQCKRCQHYLQREIPRCEIVRQPIAPGGWCEKFKAAS